MRKRIAIIDFDGTIVHHRFPLIGEPMEGAFETMKAMQEAGWALILWTCREDEGNKIEKQYLSDAIDFCKEHGIEFDGVNETPMDYEFREVHGLRRKPYADMHIDDRNMGGFPGWDVVKRICVDGEPLEWRP